MNYALTEEGRRWAMDALQRSQYTGPAPVTLEEFNERVNLQKITNEVVTIRAGAPERHRPGDGGQPDRAVRAGAELRPRDAAVWAAGQWQDHVRAAPGQRVYGHDLYPVCGRRGGQIIRVFDPSMHIPIIAAAIEESTGASFLRSQAIDARWVPCKRPFVVAGGELTLEMLDLRYDPASKFYEAPLHMKALGGCFVIDDFGRQLVSPDHPAEPLDRAAGEPDRLPEAAHRQELQHAVR